LEDGQELDVNPTVHTLSLSFSLSVHVREGSSFPGTREKLSRRLVQYLVRRQGQRGTSTWAQETKELVVGRDQSQDRNVHLQARHCPESGLSHYYSHRAATAGTGQQRRVTERWISWDGLAERLAALAAQAASRDGRVAHLTNARASRTGRGGAKRGNGHGPIHASGRGRMEEGGRQMGHPWFFFGPPAAW